MNLVDKTKLCCIIYLKSRYSWRQEVMNTWLSCTQQQKKFELEKSAMYTNLISVQLESKTESTKIRTNHAMREGKNWSRDENLKLGRIA